MDKNMINIDDLFKQRLAGGEEKEPAGAWLRMQDLLDKNMPDKVAVGYNWRRMFGYLTGLVLLSVASIGGYRMYTAHQQTDPAAVASTAKMSGVLGSSHMNALNGGTQSHDVVTASQVAISNGGNTNSGSNHSNNNPSDHKQKLLASAATHKRSAGNNMTDNSSINAQQSVKSNGETTHDKLVAGNYGFSKADNTESGDINATPKQKATKAKSVSTDTKIAKNTTNKAEHNQTKKGRSNDVTAERTASKQAGSHASVAENNIVPASGASSVNNVPATKAAENKSLAKNNVSASGGNIKKARITKDSINMITTKQTYARRGVMKVDTVEKGKIAHDVVVAEETNKQPANDIIPAASANIKSNKENSINLASNMKLGARKGSGYNESRFEQMVKNAKPDFSQISFYPGIIGGINTSIGKNNPISGFQLGVVGNLNLTQHWSVFAELKYIQNFNMNGSVIKDNYNNNLQDSIFGGQKKYSWDSVEHSWSYTSLSSIHLPVAVKYTMKQLSIFCGADFAYNFGIANSYDNTVVHHISEITSANQGSSFDPNKTTSKVSYNDLAARFGIGAVVGVGYNLTPAMQIDLRMVENLWDNTKTNGAYMVSDQVYNRPSLQLNVSYRFSKNKYRQPAP